MEKQKNKENVNTDIETVNLIGDCLETVYKCIDKDKTYLPIENLKKIINKKTNPADFEIIKTIAKGGYGEVFLVKKEKIYAMKRVSKEVIQRQPNTALFMAEKSLLVDSINSEWLVSAQMTLQDDDYLYYLMDFIPGGDFMGLLSKEDVLEEKWVRFYVVELVSALDELHKLGWIHRDLKPDNILIGKDGHIKLADFGSSIKMINGKARSSFVVGTPDYVSPDILESGQLENDYSENIDFWTLGVIIYEMLFGATPFYSLTLVETYKKITEVSYTFPFKVSDDIKDLITKLICKKEERIGINEIKSHVFFKGVDWNNVKSMNPPFIPDIINEIDTSHFIDSHFEIENRKSEKVNYIDFVGFSFDPQMVQTIKNMVTSNNNNFFDDEVASIEIINLDEKIKNKNKELQKIESQIFDAQSLLNEKKMEYKNIIEKLIEEKDEYHSIENELQTKKDEITNLDKMIEDKKILLEDFVKSMNINEDKNIKIRFFENVYDLDKLNIIKKEIDAKYMLCTQHLQVLDKNFINVKNCIDILLAKNNSLEKDNNKYKNLGIDNLKKQLRVFTTEVKEYQQKFNQEIAMRKQLEEELKSIKSCKSNIPTITHNQEFVCKLINDKQKISSVIRIINDMFYINDVSCCIGNVYIQELRNNELYHESYKNRSLILKIIFITESVKSISSSNRRSIKSLEEDYQIELNIKKGLENMMPHLKDRQLEEAKLQYEGSLKKISQLSREMELARKGTLSQQDVDDTDPIKLYEFNNHLFALKTFQPGTLCEHCNEVLYGVSDQGFECRDCKMRVHKFCYILGDVSCETYSAFKKGRSFYILMRSIEEKERLIAVYKRF